jgi:hypothetical protein
MSTGQNVRWPMNGTTFEECSNGPPPLTNTSWVISSAAVLNGDCNNDIVWTMPGTTNLLLWTIIEHAPRVNNSPGMFARNKIKVGNCLVLAVRTAVWTLSLLFSGTLMAQTNCTPPPPGLVSWWPGNGNANDLLGGNDGTPSSMVSYGPGKVGLAFVLPGDAGITVGTATNLELQNFTIEAWIQLGQPGQTSNPDYYGVGYIFGFGAGGYGFGISDDGSLVLSQIGTGPMDTSVDATNIAITDTNFHHIAVTKEADTVVFYVDGFPFSVPSFDPQFYFTTTAAIGMPGPVAVGASPEWYAFWGTIDELSIYARSLAATEVQAIYAAGAFGKCPDSSYIVSQPASKVVSNGSAVTLSVEAVSASHLVYQWSLNGTNITGATSSTISLTNVQLAQAGMYSVVITNSYGSVTSLNAILIVLTSASIILTQPASHIGVVDDYTTFSVVAQSQAPVPLSYQWSFDGTNLASATNSELVISNLTLANAGTYAVQVSNPFFATNSQTALLTMIPAPTGSNRIVANPDPNELTRALQAGGSVTFVCNGTISLSQPLVLSRDVVVDASHYAVTISGGGRNQLFAIASGVNVTLRNMTLSGGVADSGGAISNSGVLSISNVTFTGNVAGSMGGAIYNLGTVALTNVIFAGNTVEASGSASAYGGGLFNQGGTVNLHDVSFTGNVAQGGSDDEFGESVAQGYGFGGALCSTGGWVTGNAIECTNNAALSGQGQPSGFGGPSLPGQPGAGLGGAFYLTTCTVVLSNGWFVGNSTSCSAAYNTTPVGAEGGALFNAGWTTLNGIEFISNSCPGVDGIDGQILYDDPNRPAPGGPAGGGIGGGIYNMGLLTMTNCTFTLNTVSGGSGGPGEVCVTCMPQQTGPSGPPGNALGGALANFGTVNIFSNAFLNNSASGPGTDVGTIYSVCNLQVDANTTISPDTVYSVSNASAPFLAVMPQSQVVAAGSTITLTALAVGSPAPTYQWAWDGTNLGSEAAATLVLTNAQPRESGTYWVDAMNSSGSETSAPIVLTVSATSITLTGNNLGTAGFSISGAGIAGINFILEDSTNLVNWQPLQTNASPFKFVDTEAPASPFRFYRAVLTH